MISALAARKAQATPPTETTQTPKRKASPQGSNVQKLKKARKSKPFERSNGPKGTVVPLVDLLKEDKDVILVDSGETSTEENAVEAMDTEGNVDTSSDDEDIAQIDVSSFLNTQSLPQQVDTLATFTPVSDKNILALSESESFALNLASPGTLVCLSESDSLCLLGPFGLTILQGSLNILGTTLSPSWKMRRVYASRCSPLPVLTPGNSYGGSILKEDRLPRRLSNILGFPTIFCLHKLESGIEGLGDICRPFQGVFEPSKWQKSRTSIPFHGIPNLYMVSGSQTDFSAYTLPETWSTGLEASNFIERSKNLSSSSPSTYLIKGPKNTGKSTFARTLVNRLLTVYKKVAFLECDVGQTEFTPPGLVSLTVVSEPVFGPPFTHPTLPRNAHFIGSTTPKSNPSFYLEAIGALVETYRNEVMMMDDDDGGDDDQTSEEHEEERNGIFVPLVVNTMGWIKGLGGDLNQSIEEIIRPTDMFEFQPAGEKTTTTEASPRRIDDRTYRSGAYTLTSHSNDSPTATSLRMHSLTPASPSPTTTTTGFTGADYRTIAFLSYFHAIFPSPSQSSFGPSNNHSAQSLTALSWQTHLPLLSIPPFEINASIALDRIILTGAGSEDIIPEEVGRVLGAGAVVGLVVSSSCPPFSEGEDTRCGTTSEEGQPQQKLQLPYVQGFPPPPPTSSTCIGLAIVRGASPPFLHMLTPLPIPYLSLFKPRMLVKGEVELPVWGMLDFRRRYAQDKEDENGEGEQEGQEEEEDLPYLQWNRKKLSEGGVVVRGGEKRRARRNLMRRGLM